MGENPRRKSFWDPLVKQIKNKLTLLNGRFLCFVGRVCLLKSVLTYVSVYYMSLFKMSTSVSKEILKIQRTFLWG